MIEEKNELQAIADGDVVKAFLENEIVKAAWERVERRYFADFTTSDDPDKIQMVQARARALVDVARELRGVLSNGERAKEQRAQREEREARIAKNTRRSR